MYNTIILKKGEARLTYRERKKFTKGDTIWGEDENPEELKRWSIDKVEEAKAELAKYRCSYKQGEQLYYVEEYALDYCECNEEGEFMLGSDFDLAEEAEGDE